jgi:hypothetical protein
MDEMIKNCYKIIERSDEEIQIKLSALYIIRDLMETCQVPCIRLIEVFILPIIY